MRRSGLVDDRTPGVYLHERNGPGAVADADPGLGAARRALGYAN